MFIEVVDETDLVPQEDQDLAAQILAFAADHLKLGPQIECSISFVTSERIKEINRDFRGIDKVTDVISFALDEEEEDMDPFLQIQTKDPEFTRSIGDIIISRDRAIEQAQDYGHSLRRELGFLALHGFLHLNGYDHQSTEEEKEMFGLQDEILQAFGLNRHEADK